MSTSNLRMLMSRIPKVSLRGVAYIAAANFLARAVILIRNYITNYFHSEMILLYGATLDTRILLFFQSIYMIPMFLLGVLVFYGIERESFNLVLYPTLMLLFLILIRYGSESALLVVHWEDHKFNQTPELLFSLVQDVTFIVLLLLYVYVCLAFTPIKPTPMELLEGGNSSGMHNQMPSTSQNHAYQESQGFNYALRRNVGQVQKDSADKPLLDEIEQRPRTPILIKEKEGGELSVVSCTGGGGVIETDLDAVPTPAALETSESTLKPAPVAESPGESSLTVPKPKQLKKRAYLAKKLSTETAPESGPASGPASEPASTEPEKPAEAAKDIVNFWSSINGGGGSSGAAEETTAKTESFKTTSV